MASFDNLTPIEPWMFRSTLTDPWYPEAFARETESALTLALQQSLFNQPTVVLNDGSYRSTAGSTVTANSTRTGFGYGLSESGNNNGTGPGSNSVSKMNLNQGEYCSPTGTASGSGSGSGFGYGLTESGCGSGSDPETPGSGSKHKLRGGSVNCNLGVLTGKTKATKRKSRATKRSTTTFIQADPANFRQMVQQVTGVKLGDGKLPEFTVVKPEPVRQPFVNKLQGLLPTLDTSAYLLDVQSTNTRRIPVSGSFPVRSPVTENGGASVDFYSCSSFPTLESSI